MCTGELAQTGRQPQYIRTTVRQTTAIGARANVGQINGKQTGLASDHRPPLFRKNSAGRNRQHLASFSGTPEITIASESSNHAHNNSATATITHSQQVYCQIPKPSPAEIHAPNTNSYSQTATAPATTAATNSRHVQTSTACAFHLLEHSH